MAHLRIDWSATSKQRSLRVVLTKTGRIFLSSLLRSQFASTGPCGSTVKESSWTCHYSISKFSECWKCVQPQPQLRCSSPGAVISDETEVPCYICRFTLRPFGRRGCKFPGCHHKTINSTLFPRLHNRQLHFTSSASTNTHSSPVLPSIYYHNNKYQLLLHRLRLSQNLRPPLEGAPDRLL